MWCRRFTISFGELRIPGGEEEDNRVSQRQEEGEELPTGSLKSSGYYEEQKLHFFNKKK